MIIERKLYSTQILEVIKNDLLTGNIIPGEKINEVQLSQRLGVSRAPIREALSFLERDGLVVSHPKGKSIKKLSPKETYDTYLTGAILEAKSVAESCHQLTEEDFKELHSIISSIDESMIQNKEHHELDEKFHLLLMKYVDNQVLVETSRRMASRVSKFLLIKYWQKVSSAESFYDRHLELISVLQSKDKVKVEEAIINHYKVLAEKIVKLMQEDN